ncbi:MAG: V-type ATP synthase subunit D [bacterium]|nr:V-type ATP synthase subunit D [bacterium]
MAQIRLTQTALKQQKDQLKTFRRFLPTLLVKKQLLQRELLACRARIEALEERVRQLWLELDEWVGLFAEEIGLDQLVQIESIETDLEPVAGLELPRFKGLTLKTIPYDLYKTPLWTERGIDALQRLASIEAEVSLEFEAEELIAHELRITGQRVNLFEKVKIPQTQENIRRIRTHLDDQAVAAVGWARGAKKKLAQRPLVKGVL